MPPYTSPYSDKSTTNSHLITISIAGCQVTLFYSDMSNVSDFTVSFFKWASEQGLSSQDIADELGASRVVVSNWRSKSLPRIHHYAINAYMDKVKREKVKK